MKSILPNKSLEPIGREERLPLAQFCVIPQQMITVKLNSNE